MSSTRTVTATISRIFNRGAQALGLKYFQTRRVIFFIGWGWATTALFRHYVYDWGLSTGPSMYPTLPARDHMMVVNHTYARGKGIKVGDIVQVRHPNFPYTYVGKRVVGLPGDYVVRDPKLSSSVGGAVVPGVTDWKKRLNEANNKSTGKDKDKDKSKITNKNGGRMVAQEATQTEEEEERAQPEMIQVPEGHVWLAGDNFGWSRDSRSYGAVPMALIIGKSSFLAEGYFHWRKVDQAGLRKVEESEMAAVLGAES